MPDPIEMLRAALRLEDLPEGRRIAAERILAGLTTAHCARAMAWSSHKMWQRVESGERSITAAERVRIARILGVTVHRLQGTQAQHTPGYLPLGRPWPSRAAA